MYGSNERCPVQSSPERVQLGQLMDHCDRLEGDRDKVPEELLVEFHVATIERDSRR